MRELRITRIITVIVTCFCVLTTSLLASYGLYFPPNSKELKLWAAQGGIDGIGQQNWLTYARSQGATNLNQSLFANAHQTSHGLDPALLERLKKNYPPLEQRNGQTTVEWMDNKLDRMQNIEYSFRSTQGYGAGMTIYKGGANWNLDGTSQNWAGRTRDSGSHMIFETMPLSNVFYPNLDWNQSLQDVWNNGRSGTFTAQYFRDWMNTNTNLQTPQGQGYWNDVKDRNDINNDSVKRWFNVEHKENGVVKESGLREKGVKVNEVREANSSFSIAGEESTKKLEFRAPFRRSQTGLQSPMNNTNNSDNYYYSALKDLSKYQFKMFTVHNMSIFDSATNRARKISADIIIQDIVVSDMNNPFEIKVGKDPLSTGYLNPIWNITNIRSMTQVINYYWDDNPSKPASLSNNMSYGSIDSTEELSFWDIPNKQAVKIITSAPDTVLSYSYRYPNITNNANHIATSGNKAHIFTATKPAIYANNLPGGHSNQTILAAAFLDITGSSIISYRNDTTGNFVLSQFATPFGLPTYSSGTISKYVSDSNQSMVTSNALTSPNETFTYHIENVLPTIDPNDDFKTLSITDSLPQIIKVNPSNIRILDYTNTDYTNKFNINIDANNKLYITSKATEIGWMNTYRFGESFKMDIPANIDWSLDASKFETYINNNILTFKNIAEFTYQTASDGALWHDIAESEEVKTTLGNVRPTLNLVKRADKYEFLGDEEIEYTLDIVNNTTNFYGSVFATNMYIRDTVDSNTQLITTSFALSADIASLASITITDNSFSVNIPKYFQNSTTGAIIGTIKYKARFSPILNTYLGNGELIRNNARLEYNGNVTTTRASIYLNNPEPKITKTGKAVDNGARYTLEITNTASNTIGWGSIKITDRLTTSAIMRSLTITGIDITVDGAKIDISNTNLVDDIEIDTTNKAFDIKLADNIHLLNAHTALPPMGDAYCANTAVFDVLNSADILPSTKIEIEYEINLKATISPNMDTDTKASVSLGKNTHNITQPAIGNTTHQLPLLAITPLRVDKFINDTTTDILGYRDLTYEIGDSIPYKLKITNSDVQPAFSPNCIDFITIQGLKFDSESFKIIKKTPITGQYGLYETLDVTSETSITTDISSVQTVEFNDYLTSLGLIGSDINTRASFAFEYQGILDTSEQLEITYNLNVTDGINQYYIDTLGLEFENFILVNGENIESPITRSAIASVVPQTKLHLEKEALVSKAKIGDSVPYRIVVTNLTSVSAFDVNISDKLQSKGARIVSDSIQVYHKTDLGSKNITSLANITTSGLKFEINTNHTLKAPNELQIEYSVQLNKDFKSSKLINFADAWAKNAIDPHDTHGLQIYEPAQKPTIKPLAQDSPPLVLTLTGDEYSLIRRFIVLGLFIACLIFQFKLLRKEERLD